MGFSDFYNDSKESKETAIIALIDSANGYYTQLAEYMEKFIDLSEEDFIKKFIDLDITEIEAVEYLFSLRIIRDVKKRKGKKQIVFTTDRDGFKIAKDPQTGQRKEVRMSREELKNRMKAQRMGAKKRKMKGRATALKKARTLKSG